jgi:hypothetical protein
VIETNNTKGADCMYNATTGKCKYAKIIAAQIFKNQCVFYSKRMYQIFYSKKYALKKIDIL